MSTEPPRVLPPHYRKPAHYHPISVTSKWAQIVAAMTAARTNSPGQDAARDRERHNETTYARGTTGGS